MTKTDITDFLHSLKHRSAYSFDNTALRLNCTGFDSSDKLLIVRILAASVLFLLALVLELPGWAVIVLLEAAAIAAGIDILVSAVLSAASGSFRDPCIVVSLAAVISLVIGQPREEAALLLLFSRYLASYPNMILPWFFLTFCTNFR